ncbi:hypothetical protein B0H14DRAFT_3128172 [Mycena olivaceomarginata]|nr:hypothetical protein B0H14DRAFT_3128172 [Mycena olivaceomarginata]
MRPCRRRSESTKKFMRLTQWWRHIPSFKTNLRSLAALWWSDSTHLASFGDAALWPLYLYSHPHGGMPAPAPLPPAPQAAEAAAIELPRQPEDRRVLTEIGYIPGDNGIKDLDADAWATTKVLALAKARISRQHTAFLKEGCIKPLCDLLTMMNNTVIQVALDGLDNILKVGEMVKVAALHRHRGKKKQGKTCKKLERGQRGRRGQSQEELGGWTWSVHGGSKRQEASRLVEPRQAEDFQGKFSTVILAPQASDNEELPELIDTSDAEHVVNSAWRDNNPLDEI